MLAQVVGHQARHLTAIDQVFLFKRDQELAGFVQGDIVARCPCDRLCSLVQSSALEVHIA